MSDTTDLSRAKSDMRDAAHQKRAALSPSFRAEAALAAAETFTASVPIKSGQIVSLYWAIRDELSTEPLLVQLMDEGHQVCLPVVLGRDQPLEFRLWEAGQPLAPSGFGTLAPQAGAPVVVPDVMVLPMLGFDANGNRLGYGAGFYDRTIDQIEKPLILVGYAFSAQEVDVMPAEPHDKPLDMVVSEAGVRRFLPQEKN
ncbi:5-formyltetrahydrofolate cyclo-ligase [uncultured Maritalea sp.]|uniref:5-formyltetrahydrofolate cyclo-ligase n=1 Tax=uncultured Maritalea sp. TaxID=757249 RepID=UPI0026351F5C|nr:5-formyltetrahydrofolate cyclo-ligase [uncultured Maritalea sp.]